jgi:hypothetical protein
MHFQKKEANKECTCDERDANGRCERGEADKKDKQTWKDHIFWRKKFYLIYFSLSCLPSCFRNPNVHLCIILQ